MDNRKDSNPGQNCPEPTDNETDQSSRGYYDDDSTGYEIYEPESEGDEGAEAEVS